MRVAFANATGALEREGCDAAGYRLAGEGLDKLCVIHLWGRWRLVLAFPVQAVLAGQFLSGEGGRGTHRLIGEALGLVALALAVAGYRLRAVDRDRWWLAVALVDAPRSHPFRLVPARSQGYYRMS